MQKQIWAQHMLKNATSEETRMIRAGQLLTSPQFCESMGWTKQALSKALAAHRVFFVTSGNERYYPAFYASTEYDRRHLESVSKILGDLPGSAKLQFFCNERVSLNGQSPLHALMNGKFPAVKTAAMGFAER